VHNLAWIDGVFIDLAEAKVPLEDRGYLLGDGVYEVTRVYSGRPFYITAHLERLQRSADAIKITIPYTKPEIEQAAAELISKSGCGDGYIYMQVTRGSARRDHLFPADTPSSMTMYTRELAALIPVESVVPIRCITLPDERWLNCHIKTVNLLPNLLARQKASEAGAVEAILYRPGDLVTEGTRSNVFAVIDGMIRTHPTTNLILPGVTRSIVLSILNELAIDYSESAFSLQDLRKASEVWITSTTMEVNPVAEIDGQPIEGAAPGPVCAQLMKKFREIIADNS
jgi:D-alanine transaminase